MAKFYSIPAAREDSDRRNFMLEIEDMQGGILWRAYREGDQQISAGATPLNRLEKIFVNFDDWRIIVDSRDRAVLYAESIEDKCKVFQHHPSLPSHLIIYPNKFSEVYRMAEPLPMEVVEAQSMDKSPIGNDFAEWASGIPVLDPSWKKYLEKPI